MAGKNRTLTEAEHHTLRWWAGAMIPTHEEHQAATKALVAAGLLTLDKGPTGEGMAVAMLTDDGRAEVQS